jgi:hypothetical protein
MIIDYTKYPELEKELNKNPTRKENIESLATVIDLYKSTSVDTVLDDNFSVKIDLSSGWNMFWMGVSAISEFSAVSNISSVASDKTTRDVLLASSDSWKALMTKSDSIIKFLDTNEDFASRLIGKFSGLNYKVLDGKDIPKEFKRDVVKHDLLPLIRDVISAAGEDPMGTGESVGKLISSIMTSKKVVSPIDLISNILDITTNPKITKVFKDPINIMRINSVLERSYLTAPDDIKATLYEYGISTDEVKEIIPVITNLVKESITSKDVKKIVEDTINIFIRPEKEILKPENEVKSLFDNLEKLFSIKSVNEILKKEKYDKILASRILPIIAKIEDVKYAISPDVLANSKELGSILIRSFINDPSQLKTFYNLIAFETGTIKDIGKSVIDLVGADPKLIETLNKKTGDEKDPYAQLSKIIENTISKIIKTDVKAIDTYLKCGAPIIIEFAKNTISKGDIAKGLIDNLLGGIDDIFSLEGKKARGIIIADEEQKTISNSLKDKILNFSLSPEYRGVFEDKAPVVINENKDILIDALKPIIDDNPDMNGITAEHLIEILGKPDVVKKITSFAESYQKNNNMQMCLKAVNLIFTSKEVRSAAFTYVSGAISKSFNSVKERIYGKAVDSTREKVSEISEQAISALETKVTDASIDVSEIPSKAKSILGITEKTTKPHGIHVQRLLKTMLKRGDGHSR